MMIMDLQRAIGTTPDGIWGRKSDAALMRTFTNRAAPAIGPADIAAAAARLGCSELQVQAVRQVEAGGRGFDGFGRPKILFERHKFHKFTGGRFSVTTFSDPVPGGYGESSWEKLSAAIAACDVAECAVDAAFMACSWGAFQVLGEWWSALGYPSPFAMAWTCAQSEGDHLDMLVRYIEHFALQDEIRALTSNPETCRPFAAAYNGAGYVKFDYHRKLAAVMKG